MIEPAQRQESIAEEKAMYFVTSWFLGRLGGSSAWEEVDEREDELSRLRRGVRVSAIARPERGFSIPRRPLIRVAFDQDVHPSLRK